MVEANRDGNHPQDGEFSSEYDMIDPQESQLQS